MPAYETKRRVAFTARQMFDLVADVEKYPEFVPLCDALEVKSRSHDGTRSTVIAAMSVGYKGFRETFTSRVLLDPAALAVSADLVDGPFQHLENRWRFTELPGGSEVAFAIRYEFDSFLLQMLAGGVFDQAIRRYAEAFEDRAKTVYGCSTSLGQT